MYLEKSVASLKESEENCKKGGQRYPVESLLQLSPTVMWKREYVPNELMDMDKRICRQNVEKANWFLSDAALRYK